jgi:hypothetical protein
MLDEKGKGVSVAKIPYLATGKKEPHMTVKHRLGGRGVSG